jgi:hypothetical protein
MDPLGLDGFMSCMNDMVRWSFDGGKTWSPWYASGSVTCVGGGGGGSQIGVGGTGNNGGGGGPRSMKAVPSQKQLCDSIQQNYDRAANESNAKWDTRFWVSVGAGAAAGGYVGALGGAAVALVYDESKSDYNKITQDASQQWQAAGCPGSLKSAF